MLKSSGFGLIIISLIIIVSLFLIVLPSNNLKDKNQKAPNPTSLKNVLAPPTVIWSENFNNGCASNCIASTWNGWTIVDNVGGTTGGAPNNWFVSCAEEGITPPGCATSCIGDASLHIGLNPGAGGDSGGSYNETGASNATYKLAVSPTISTVGLTTLTLSFDFIAYGSAACSEDRAQLRLSTDNGATWPVAYQYCLTSVCCGACNGYSAGQWTVYTLALPVAFENNPNVRVGFHWANNGNGSGTDPSVAIDDIRITTGTVTPDYTITTTSNSIVITDVSGNGETLNVSENGANIRFNVSGKTYSIDGGVLTTFTTPADIPLAGKTSIIINTANGDDIINVGAFATSLPSFTINGGTGNDNINLNGNITFTSNSILDLDLQNDDASPGTDAIALATSTNLILAGSGTATLKVSKNLIVNSGAILRTVNGALVVEANQQATASTGDFTGVNILGGTIEATGTGNVTVKGKGGNGSDSQRGINVSGGGKIFGGTSGTLTVDGRAGISSGTSSNGIRVSGATSKISSYGATVNVNAKGN